jgi:hypothetical protein
MALAPFFDKAALAASHVLQGFDPARFAAALERHVIAAAFDRAAVQSDEGRITLDLVANLLARLYPRVALIALDTEAEEYRGKLVSTVSRINPRIDISGGIKGVSFCVTVGETRPPTECPTLYLGSDGWVVEVSPEAPVGSGATGNPFGAAAAACVGAANAFRVAFAAQLPSGGMDGGWRMSLMDLDPSNSTPPNPQLVQVNLGELHLVGVGAIGNGAVWALGRVSDLRGTLHLIDPEAVDETNPQRYILATPEDVGVAKVALAKSMLGGCGLDVRPHQATWGTYLSTRDDWRLGRVAVALDSARDRRAVQASLPWRVLNAWTQTGDLGISRHPSLEEGACLACLYMPDGPVPNEDELVAEAIGLHGPEGPRQIRGLLYSNAPIGREWVERIAASLGLPLEPFLPFANRPLRAFYAEAVCGGMVMSLGGSSGAGARAEVPMAFQSALAGVLLAAELVADAMGFKTPAASVTRIDLLRPLGAFLTQLRGKSPSKRCICQDATFVEVYRRKYGAANDTCSTDGNTDRR